MSMEPSPLYSVEVPKPVEDGAALEFPMAGVSFAAGTVAPQSGRVRQIIDVGRSKVATARPAEPVDRTDAGDPGGDAGASDLYRKIHRALRGRYGRVVALGLIGAALGAGAGWKLGKADYESDGVVRIASYRTPADKNPDQPRSPQFYDQFMKTQEALLA